MNQNIVEWIPDGSSVIFSQGDHLRIVGDWEGAEIRSIVDMNPLFDMTEGGHSNGFLWGVHADLSPDGSRIAYATCEHQTLGIVYPDDTFDSREVGPIRHYEIATIGVDGSSPARLTVNRHYDHFPAWSPDGTRIAFIDGANEGGPYPSGLSVMSEDGSDVSNIIDASFDRGVYPSIPSWSPDGSRLAIIGTGGFYTVRTDGTGLNRIQIGAKQGDVVKLLTWSPSGEEIALVAGPFDLPGESTIYTVRPDGSGLREIWSGWHDVYGPNVVHLSWSPDGSELLLIAREQGMYVISRDGGELHRFPMDDWPWLRGSPFDAAWSPDGSRIAVVYNRIEAQALFTLARDGSHIRYLLTKPENCRLDSARGLNCNWVTAPPPRNILPSYGYYEAKDYFDWERYVGYPARLRDDEESNVQARGRLPCSTTEGGHGPCEPRAVSSFRMFSGHPGGGHANSGAPATSTVEDVREKGLELSEASPVHLAARGTADADSVRCGWRGIARTPAQREDAIRFWLGLGPDVRVLVRRELYGGLKAAK